MIRDADREWPCGAPVEEGDDYCKDCERGDCEYQRQQDEIHEAMNVSFVAQVRLKEYA